MNVALVIIGWGLASAGMLLALWAMFWDRSRGRRRCPKCWYDMRGVPGPVCPECGQHASREARLYRTRRRWGWAGVACIVWVAAWASHHTPAMRQHGWPAQVPTSVLLIALPWLQEATWSERQRAQRDEVPLRVRARLYDDLISRRALMMPAWQRRWLLERCIAGDGMRPFQSAEWHRCFAPVIMRLHYAAALGRLTAEERAAIAGAAGPGAVKSIRVSDRELRRIREGLVVAGIRGRERWPQDVPILIGVRPHRASPIEDHVLVVKARLPDAATLRNYGVMGARPGQSVFDRCWNDGLQVAGTADRTGRGVLFDATVLNRQRTDGGWDESVMFESTVAYPLRIVATVEEVVRSVEHPALERTLAQHLRPRGQQRRNAAGGVETVRIDMFARERDNNGAGAIASALAKGSEVTLALRIELYCQGRLMAEGAAWWSAGPGGEHLLPRDTVVELRAVNPEDPAWNMTTAWELRVSGDPVVALRNLRSETYWGGTVKASVEWVGKR